MLGKKRGGSRDLIERRCQGRIYKCDFHSLNFLACFSAILVPDFRDVRGFKTRAFPNKKFDRCDQKNQEIK